MSDTKPLRQAPTIIRLLGFRAADLREICALWQMMLAYDVRLEV
jgi:hypothetical protein